MRFVFMMMMMVMMMMMMMVMMMMVMVMFMRTALFDHFARLDTALQKQSIMSRDLARVCMERLAAVLKQAFRGAKISQVKLHSSTHAAHHSL